jgi:hypothetical protein
MPVTTHASSTRQVEFCGRDSKLEVITATLGQLGDGTSAVVVIEGGAGMGKSRLLAEVIGVARALGARVGASAADPSESVVELAALLAALSDPSSPLVDRDAFGGLRREAGQRFWLLRDLEGLLERCDPGLVDRTWVLITEAPEGGWGIDGHANTGQDIVAAARAALAAGGEEDEL